MPSLNTLPDELKSLIIAYLDVAPPSWTWENMNNLTHSQSQPLKSLLLVSRSWYQLVSPIVYSHLRLRLQNLEQVNEPPLLLTPKIKTITSSFKEWLFRDWGYPHDIRLPYRHVWQDAPTEKAAKWAAALSEQLSELLAFLNSTSNGSDGRSLNSLTIVATGELNDKGLDYIRDEVHCLIATDAFWNLLFEQLDPQRVTILAPPSKLACLLGCSMNMQDSWAFPGMSMQLVSLWKEPKPTDINDLRRMPSESDYSMMQPIELIMEPNEYGRPALSSLMYIRPWTHLAVNEGSFLEAYSTYEYFHKNPPGIMAAIGRAFRLEMSIWSVAYKGIFPFVGHIGAPLDRITYKNNPSNVRKLYVKLAPNPEDKILDDPEQVGKADITDCWREVESMYRFLTDPAIRGDTDFAPPGAVHEGQLDVFTYGDDRVASVQQMVTTSLQSAEWEEVAKDEWHSPRLSRSLKNKSGELPVIWELEQLTIE